MAKAAFNKKKTPLISKLELTLTKELVKWYTSGTEFYGIEICTLWKLDQKYLERFETWRWRRMDSIWTGRVKLYTQSVRTGISCNKEKKA
jgi:hypothetical protein